MQAFHLRWRDTYAATKEQKTVAILEKLESPSDPPSINPSHAAAIPIVAKKAGIRVVAISCDQSPNRLANPMPRTVLVSQRERIGELVFTEFSGRSGWWVD